MNDCMTFGDYLLIKDESKSYEHWVIMRDWYTLFCGTKEEMIKKLWDIIKGG